MNVDKSFQLKDGRTLGYADLGDPEGTPLLYIHSSVGYRLEPQMWDNLFTKNKIRTISEWGNSMGRVAQPAVFHPSAFYRA